MAGSGKKRLLFFGEAATLSHVVRPWVLATSVDPSRYDAIFCRHPRYAQYFNRQPAALREVPLQSESSEKFLQNLFYGRPAFDEPTLDRYIGEDLKLIDAFQPDFVIGDLRLSLAISARLKGIPYINICNAYWHPNLNAEVLVPDIPLRRALGRFIGQKIFNAAIPLALKLHMKPLNRLAKKYGLPPLGEDIRHAYTAGDHVLFSDPPSVFPALPVTRRCHYIGPILWAPDLRPPVWWSDFTTSRSLGRPTVFVTLGSSGTTNVLKPLLSALSELPITVLVSTLGRENISSQKNILAADMLSAPLATAHASLTICNGGSTIAYQALAAGSAVLGVPSNMDQYLNMHYLQKQGVGRILEAPDISPASIKKIVGEMLVDNLLSQRVSTLKNSLSDLSATKSFRQFLENITEASKEEAA